jgi:Spy/CpxP family protein refolding chaperone
MKLLSFALLLAAVLPAAAAAQTPPAGDDPIARHVVPPELVMKHSQAIGLTSEQRDAIKKAIQEAQSGFIDPQWQMQTEAGRMAELLQQRPLDEAAILGQLDRILDLERRIKKLQFSLLVRIKNTLSVSQLEKLERLRAQP